MRKKTNVVIFDFDGTLSARDSNTEFFKYCFKHSVRPWFFLPLILFAIIIRPLNKSGVFWRQIIRRFTTKKMVKDFSPDFIKQHIKQRFGWAADVVKTQRAAGNVVVLISAGPDYLIPKLVHDIKFDAIICSDMDKNKPWKYKFLCFGKNKVTAFNKWAKDKKIIPNVVRSYSDSKSDLPIMNLAPVRIWINRKTGTIIQ